MNNPVPPNTILKPNELFYSHEIWKVIRYTGGGFFKFGVLVENIQNKKLILVSISEFIQRFKPILYLGL